MSKEYNMYTEMLSLLDKYEKDVYSKWCNGLEHVCLINLQQPLLTRNTSSGLISVNFNPKVINALFAQSRYLPIVETRQSLFCFCFPLQSD